MCTTCGCGHSGPHMHEHVDADGNVTLTPKGRALGKDVEFAWTAKASHFGGGGIA